MMLLQLFTANARPLQIGRYQIVVI